MYTFAIAAVLSFILAGAIFGKRIKQNQMTVAMIVFAGTFLASVITNGILGKDIPYTLVKTKTKYLYTQHSEVRMEDDTLFYKDTDLKYRYVEEYKKNGDTTLSHYIDIGGIYDEFYPSNSGNRKLFVELLPKEDSSDAYVDIYRYKKIPNNRWVSKIGLPMGGRKFHVYLENCPRNSTLMEHINEKFYGIEKPGMVTVVNTDSTNVQWTDVVYENESN